MMATYTIYPPRQCSSPIEFVSADFWNTPGVFRVTVKNVSSKPITNITAKYDFLMTRQYRRRPFQDEGWTWNTPLQPGQQQTFEMKGLLPNYAEKVFAWILFPQTVVYQDGEKWSQQRDGDCFQVFWRDKDQLPLPVLPPLFMWGTASVVTSHRTSLILECATRARVRRNTTPFTAMAPLSAS